MFGAFGGIGFTVLGGPDKLSFEDESHYAKIDVIKGPPVLQWIFDDLTRIELGIYLHQMWCDPTSAIADLQQQRTLHQPAPMVIGVENKGNYVITNLRQRDVWRADDGTLIAARCELSLLQWAGTLPASAPTVQTNANALGTTTAGPGATPLQAPAPASAPVAGDFADAPLSTATRSA
jgi:hypothetical protein